MRHWLRRNGWQVLMVALPLAAWVLAAWSLITEGGV